MSASSYWSRFTDRRTNRRRVLTAIGGTSAAAAFLIACGSDDDDSSGTGGSATGTTGSTGGATGSSGSAASGSRLTADTVAYSREHYKLTNDTDNAVEGGTYAGRENAELFGTIDPITQTHDSTRRIGRDVYEFLMTRNIGPGVQPGSSESLIMNPHLASAWEMSPDGLTYTFTLRQDVKFHNVAPVNGRAMTIDDWRTSLERFLETGAYRQTLNGVLDSADFPDANTMVWHMKEKYAPLLLQMDSVMAAFPIMPKELNDDPELAATTAIGTNYRQLTKNQTSVARDFVRHDEYWKGRPHIAKWNFPVIPEYANAQAQFIAQNIINFASSAQDALRLREDAPGSVMVANEPSYNAPNLRIGRDRSDSAPWHDVRVRIALRRAVNYELFTEVISNKAAFDAAGIDVQTSFSTHAMSDPSFWLDPREGALGAASENYLFNLDEAKKLLEAAGYPDGFDINFVSNADPSASPVYNPSWYERNDLMAKEYEQTGLFKTNMEMQPYEQFQKSILEWPHYGLLVGFSVQGVDIDAGIYRQYHSSNSPAYPDAEMDSILEAQRRETDVNKRIDIIKQYQHKAAELFMSVPVWGSANTFHYEWPWLHNIAGWRAPNLDYYENGHLLWLDPEMPRRDR